MESPLSFSHIALIIDKSKSTVRVIPFCKGLLVLMLVLVKLWVIKVCLNLGLESEFGNSATEQVY